VINILLNNVYPLSFIFHTIVDRLNILFPRFNRLDDVLTVEESVSDDVNGGERISYFNVPYVRNISERFRHCVRDLDVKLSY
ncbi:hypothetical protein EAG_05707, partial [Camponotus floridanus]